jgi:hypothetical protein
MAVNPRNRSKNKRSMSPSEAAAGARKTALRLWKEFNKRMGGEPNAEGVVEAGIPKSALGALISAVRLGGPKAGRRFLSKVSKVPSKTPSTRVTKGVQTGRARAQASKVAKKKEAAKLKSEKAKKKRQEVKAAKLKAENIVKRQKSVEKVAVGTGLALAAAAGGKALTKFKRNEATERMEPISRSTEKAHAAKPQPKADSAKPQPKAEGETFKERDAKNREAAEAYDIDVTPKPRGAKPKSVMQKKRRQPKILDNKAEFDKLSFGQAFRVAKNSTAKGFTWRGKRFHTRTKEEEHAAAKKFVEKEQTKIPKPRVSDEKVEIKTDVIKERSKKKRGFLGKLRGKLGSILGGSKDKDKIRGGRRYGRRGHQRVP